jgi:hypothetical protein
MALGERQLEEKQALEEEELAKGWSQIHPA